MSISEVPLMSADAYLRRQTIISIIVSAVFSAVFFLLIYRNPGPVAVWAPDYLALDFVPQSALASLMAALVPGLQTRSAVARGNLAGTVPTARSIVLRALLCALLGLGVAVIIIAALWISGVVVVPWATAFAIKTAYGGLLGRVVTPRALRPLLNPVS